MSKKIENLKIDLELINDRIAAFEGKSLNSERRELLNELYDCRTDLEKQIRGLSTDGPLTLQGPAGSREYRSGRPAGGGPFGSLGEQLRAVASAETPGQDIDRRLYSIRAQGLNETTPSSGGFLVQADFSYDLLAGLFDVGSIPGLTNRFQIQGDSIKLPAVDETSRATGSRWGGVRGYWISEAAEITKSQPRFRQLELNLKKMAVLCYASDEVLSDARVLEQVIQQSFYDEMSFMITDSIIRGSGAGMPLGVLNAGSLITVDKEAGQDADTLVTENLVKMWARLLPRSKQNAVWLINPSIEPQLYQLALSVGTGGLPVFLPAGGMSATPYMSLLGRPVIPCESCSTLGDLGDIVLADLGGYVLAEKAGGPKFAQSIAVRFVYDEMAFRLTYRFDGAPMLASAITPAQGVDTMSHFVTLEAR